MDIMIGIDEDSYGEKEIETLAESGATEFFCGIMPDEWVSLYGYQISLNKREWMRNQFLSFEKLAVAIQRAHKTGIKVAVAMNAHCYTDKQLPLVESYLKILQELKPNAVIVGNLPLLLLIKKLDLDIPVYISGEYPIYSARAVESLVKYGIKRVLFPRDMSITEMKKIIDNTKEYGIEYEAFLLSEKCVLSTGYCRATHGYLPVNFCHQRWGKSLYLRVPPDKEAELLKPEPGGLPAKIPAPALDLVINWNTNSALYKAFTDANFYPSATQTSSCWGGCGLCAVRALQAAGITSFKVVSRGTSFVSKISKLKMISKVLKGIPIEEIKKIKDTPEICEIGYNCYYREAGRLNG